MYRDHRDEHTAERKLAFTLAKSIGLPFIQSQSDDEVFTLVLATVTRFVFY